MSLDVYPGAFTKQPGSFGAQGGQTFGVRILLAGFFGYLAGNDRL